MAKKLYISIHVPREGHDLCLLHRDFHFPQSQSTCPARGTTSAFLNGKCRKIDFNPRAPRGARLTRKKDIGNTTIISIHVPREGHDLGTAAIFLQLYISIHVPREGHDRRR